MDVPAALLAVLVALLALAVAVAALALRHARRLSARVAQLDTSKRSQSTRYGNITEQFAPWMKGWPFAEPSGFRFLGKPVDGVQFERDAVYFVEVKAAGSRLSPEQQAVRDAVLAGRVGWVTFRAAERAEAEMVRPWEHRGPAARP